MAGHVSAVLTLDGEVAGFLEAVGEGVGAAGEEEEHCCGWVWGGCRRWMGKGVFGDYSGSLG